MAEPRASRAERQERKQKTRLRVIEAILELLEDRPLNEITVEQVAQRADISRAAFYTYFDDKMAVLQDAYQEVHEQIFEQAALMWAGEGDSLQRAHASLAGICRVYAENRALSRAGFEMATYDDAGREYWFGLLDRFILAIAEHIKVEQQAGFIAPHLDPDRLSPALCWMVERLCHVEISVRNKPVDTVVEEVYGLWVAALYPSR